MPFLNNGINEDELNRFFFADYGLNFLEDWDLQPQQNDPRKSGIVQKNGHRHIEGWHVPFDHQMKQSKSSSIMQNSVNQPVNRPQQRWALSHYQSLYIPEGQTEINTLLQPEDFNYCPGISMLENGCLDQPISYNRSSHTFPP
jgi:hypothetical protein